MSSVWQDYEGTISQSKVLVHMWAWRGVRLSTSTPAVPDREINLVVRNGHRKFFNNQATLKVKTLAKWYAQSHYILGVYSERDHTVSNFKIYFL